MTGLLEIDRALESALRAGLPGTGTSGLRLAALHQDDCGRAAANHEDPEHDPQPCQIGIVAGGRLQALGVGQVGGVLPRDGVAGDLTLAVRTLPGKVTLTSKSVIMVALIPCKLPPGM